MLVYTSSTTINASPDRIWAILTDAEGYPEWDPGMMSIEGPIAPGQQLTIRAKISPNRTFTPKVTVFEPGQRMVWHSGMPLGLFTGSRSFVLTPQDDGQTGFTLREEFSGPLLPLIGRSIPDMTATFDAFTAGLKARAEG